MHPTSVRSLLFTLLIGFLGASAATAAHLPAAPLVGASIAVSVASLFKLTVDIPVLLRNAAFTVIGCSLGSGITREALSQAGQWPLSLLALSGAVCVTMAASSWVLCRFSGQSADTALLATSPGALAYSLGLAASGIGDIRTIIVIQNIRLLVVTSLLPFILDNFGFALGSYRSIPETSGAGSLLVILIAFALGTSVARWKIPASFLLAGMLISGVGHYLGLVVGRPSGAIIFTGFAVTGSMVGARFSTIPLRDVKRLLVAALGVVVISGLLSLAFAVPVAEFLDLPYGQVFVAYAPGGVEAMAAMALSLGYDPAYVATHHLFRIILLFFLLPLGLGLVRKMKKIPLESSRS
jgi:membrane AbrB-like protein